MPRAIHGRLVRSWVLGDRRHQVHPGVFAVGHTALPRTAQFLAATWWCGGDGASAGESACAFYGWIGEDLDHPPPIRIMWEELELDDRRVADELSRLLDSGGCVL